MSYTVTITKTVETEEVEKIYVDSDEAEKMGLEKKSGYVPKLTKKHTSKEIYSQVVEEDALNINNVIKAVMGEGK